MEDFDCTGTVVYGEIDGIRIVGPRTYPFRIRVETAGKHVPESRSISRITDGVLRDLLSAVIVGPPSGFLQPPRYS